MHIKLLIQNLHHETVLHTFQNKTHVSTNLFPKEKQQRFIHVDIHVALICSKENWTHCKKKLTFENYLLFKYIVSDVHVSM